MTPIFTIGTDGSRCSIAKHSSLHHNIHPTKPSWTRCVDQENDIASMVAYQLHIL